MFLPKSKCQSGGGTLRREKCLEGLDFFCSDSDELVTVNEKFLAVVLEGSTCLVVVPIEKTGKTDTNLPKIFVNNKRVTCIKWNPFDGHEISSASEDGTIRLWKIPDGGLTRDTSVCQSLLTGHTKEVSILEWNPCAADVLLSIGMDMKCLIWNVRIESTFMEITVPGSDVVSSVSWSPCGSSFVVLWKDQSLRVIEPRTGNSVLSTTLENSKPGEAKKVLYVDDNKLLTVASSTSDITIRLWIVDGSCLKLLKEETTHDNHNSHNNQNSHNNINDISVSSFLDCHRETLYVFQKDSGCLRIYKLMPDDVSCVASHVTSPCRGLAMMPVSGLNISKNEFVRFYKVTPNKRICELISISGTNNNKTVDASKHHVPQYSADQWFQGQRQTQILSPLTIKIKKPEYSSNKDHPTPSSSSSSPPPAAPLPASSPQPSMMSSSSSFIHLTFSSPKMTRKLTKGFLAESEQCLLKAPDVIPRRNSSVAQQHYLYSQAPPSPTPSRYDTLGSLSVGGTRGPPIIMDTLTSFNNLSQPQLIQNRAYKGSGEVTRRGSAQHGLVPIKPLENGLEPGRLKATPKRVSPRTRSHKSPTLSAVRLRRMKQKELLFHSSSSSSSEEGVDKVGKTDRWNDNPLYSQSHKSRKNPPRPRSKGRPESQRKHSLNPISDRCSVIDFGPLDDALNQVINDHKSLSRSTCDISQVSKRNDLFRFQKIEPVDQTGSKNIPFRDFSGTRGKRITDDRGVVNEFPLKNPILNGCLDAGHHRSAFSIVKPPANHLIHGQGRFSNSVAFNKTDAVPHLNYRNNFHSTDRLTHCGDSKSDDFKLEFLRLRPSSQLLRAVSLRESESDVPHLLNRSKVIQSNSFSAQRMQKINQSTPQLTGSIEHFHPLPSLQTSLQTIAEDDPRFQSVNGCYFSSSSSSSSLSSNTDCTLHSDHSTVNYELNNNYQRLSLDDEGSQLSGPDEISNSFTYKGPLSNQVMRDGRLKSTSEVAEKDIFEKCSRQKDEIEDLKKELNVKEEKIKILEEQLKRISMCSDG